MSTTQDAAVYVPTPVQTTAVTALDSLSRPPQVVDAVAVATVATVACGNDWAHGAATVYGGPCAGLCLPCAVVAVRAAHWGVTGTDVGALDVLRHPAVTR